MLRPWTREDRWLDQLLGENWGLALLSFSYGYFLLYLLLILL